MNFFYRSSGIFILLMLISGKSLAQNIEIDISGCRAMYYILTAMKEGAPEQKVTTLLDSVLKTKPYQAMFRHYNRSWRPNHLPVPVFRQMIISLQSDSIYSGSGNERAKQMFPFWYKFYTDPGLFRNNLRQLEATNIKELIKEAVAYSQGWLPPGWNIPDFDLIIQPNGGSRAFALDTIQGYDFFQLPRDSSGNIIWEELTNTISHESHHLGIKNIYPPDMSASDSVTYEFLSLFLGEGTATKFISNYPGGCVPIIDQSRQDPSISHEEIANLWHKYTLEEPELFKHLIATFECAYSGELSHNGLQNEISKYWLNGYISPVYFIGSKLFGAVYFGFGKEGVFTVMHDLRKLFLFYNNSIKIRPDILAGCNIIPDSIVQHALSIGSMKY